MSGGPELSPHRHVGELYRDDAELAAHVALHLRPGLAAGYPTMVIATPALRSQLESAFLTLDADLDTARKEGTLLEFDADELLYAISPDGHVEWNAFNQAIGAVARSFPSGTPIPSFAQMVGMLWEQGNVKDALDLEEMWNRLSLDVSIHAYCGYRADAFTTPTGIATLAALHDHLVLSSIEHLGLEPEPASARSAREFAAETLRRWDLAELHAEVELIVSELVTNAIVHTRAHFTLSLAHHNDLLRIAVRDASRTPPSEGTSNHAAPHGRGIRIVRSLSNDFGTFVAPDGKTVWAHLSAESAS